MKKQILFAILGCFMFGMVSAQKTIVEGYTFETNNRGYLREVKITVYSANNAIKAETSTNKDGFFTVELNPGENYKIKATKSIFEDTYFNLKAADMLAGKKAYAKIEMHRKPGYLFDVTLSESYYDMDGVKNGIDEAKIEIYNNTTNEEVLVLEKHKQPNFTYTFEQGNHYTVMIRKEDYFTKRMEAHVNIDGCILCFEGMGNVRPSDNLTEGNTMGSLIANVELDRIRLKQGIKIENIYYDYNKWDIRPDAALELDKIVLMMTDNPNLIIEIGSHTDSRGRDEYNLELSEKRAKSAVAYVMREGGIPASRVKARGYGESQIANRCVNDVACSDEEHEQNRRTMIKVVGFTEDNSYDDLSLREIIYNENLEKASFEDFESVEYVEGGELPEEIRKDLERQRKRAEARAAAKANGGIAATTAETIEVPEVKEEAPKTTVSKETVIAEKAASEIKPTKKQLRRPSTRKKNKRNTAVSKVEDETSKGGDVIKKEDKKGLFGETVEKPKPKLPLQQATIAPARSAKLLEPDYTGFMVEFFNSNIELSPGHSIFKQYGQVKMEEKENGEFAYLIGGFNSADEAADFLDKILKTRFPAAKVVTYENGKRLEE